MTNEEMERGIDFLLKSQASFEARLERIAEQTAENGRQIQQAAKQIEQATEQIQQAGKQIQQVAKMVEALADSQNDLTQIVTRHVETQGQFDAQAQNSIRELTRTQSETSAKMAETDVRINRLTKSAAETDARLARLAESAAATDARLDRIADLIERHISEGHRGAPHSNLT